VGGFGFLWLVFWFWLYTAPAKQKRLGKAEFDYIHSDADEQAAEAKATEAKAAASDGPKTPWYVEWGKLLTYRQTWSFAFGKFMTDGIWWFFLFWLPAYLKAQYGMTGNADFPAHRRALHHDLRREHKRRMVPDVLHQPRL